MVNTSKLKRHSVGIENNLTTSMMDKKNKSVRNMCGLIKTVSIKTPRNSLTSFLNQTL